MSFAAELPEADDDWEWQKIVNDPRPRPALTALGDAIAEQFLPKAATVGRHVCLDPEAPEGWRTPGR